VSIILKRRKDGENSFPFDPIPQQGENKKLIILASKELCGRNNQKRNRTSCPTMEDRKEKNFSD
jgi:hypothetical protein